MDRELSADFTRKQDEVVNIILESVSPEKIYLLGYTCSDVYTHSIFCSNQSSHINVDHFYMLILVNCNNSSGYIQEGIENNCRSLTPVTTIIFEMDEFYEWLKEGHPFSSKVYSKAICLYDSGKIPCPVLKKKDEDQFIKTNVSILKTELNRVQGFLGEAGLYRKKEQNKMATFLLYQAAEQILRTLFKIATGLDLPTRNLDKLLRYCSMVSIELESSFPRNNEKSERLIQLLQNAHIDTRYREDYSIGTEDLISITERVKALLDVLKKFIPI